MNDAQAALDQAFATMIEMAAHFASCWKAYHAAGIPEKAATELTIAQIEATYRASREAT